MFISLPVYRWVFGKVNKSKNRNGLPQGRTGDLRGRQRTKGIGQRACETWEGRELGASVGPAWIHAAGPAQLHIKNDVPVKSAMCQCEFMDWTASSALIANIAYAGARPYATVKRHKLSFSLTGHR